MEEGAHSPGLVDTPSPTRHAAPVCVELPPSGLGLQILLARLSF